MKRLKTTLIVLLCAIACKAQTDETKLQVIYNAYYLQYAEDDSLSRDIAQLDIGTNTSRYYSKVSEWYNFNPVGKAPYPGTKIKWTPKTGIPYEIFPQNHKKKNNTKSHSRKRK